MCGTTADPGNMKFLTSNENLKGSAAHFSRFEFFAKSEKNQPIFREKCEKLRKN